MILKLICFLLVGCEWANCRSLTDPKDVKGSGETDMVQKLPNQVEHYKPGHMMIKTPHLTDPSKCGTYSNFHLQHRIDVGPQIESAAGIVEILVVIDKELGDTFGQDRGAILDYLTVYFWDISLRYKTLEGVSLSFRITGVIIISNVLDQPFIEYARRPGGTTNFYSVLEYFNQWLYENSFNPNIPKYDVATLFTITQDTRPIAGVAAQIGGACKIDEQKAGVILRDTGTFDSLLFAAHEIGHALGSPHDNDNAGCKGSFVMNAKATTEKRWFFSNCSSIAISRFVRSEEASCLKKLDAKGPLPISPDFSSVRAPTMTYQCQLRLGNTEAFVPQEETNNCTRLRCVWPAGDELHYVDLHLDLDNTPCMGEGRCFRGLCRQEGSLVVNSGSGKCLVTADKFRENSSVTLTTCPNANAGTPLDRFVILNVVDGKIISTPFQAEGPSHGEACLSFNIEDESEVLTDNCDTTATFQKWELVNLGKEEFLIRHLATRRCLKSLGNKVKMSRHCDKNDGDMKWKFV